MNADPDGSDRQPGTGGRLIVLCGRSFSGKSTVATWLRDGLGGTVVSFDAINEARGLHGGQGISLDEWIRTGEIATRQARQSLQDGDTVIVDDTSSPRILRDGWRALAAELHVATVLVFVELRSAIRRVTERLDWAQTAPTDRGQLPPALRGERPRRGS